MRSNHLLSLLAHNQEGRVRSLAHRQAASPTFSFLPRSNSTSLKKHPVRDQQQVSTHMIKVFHLLNVKVKQSYFFSFCKIEQLSQKIAKKKIQIEKPLIKEMSQQKREQKKDKLMKISEGLNIMCEFQSTISSKLWMRQKLNLFEGSFKTLQIHSSKVQFMQKISKFMREKTIKTKRQFFKGVKLLQKQRIRLQIMTDNLQQIVLHKKSNSFLDLKQWKPKREDKKIQQQISEDISKRKVLIKQKKTTVAIPISIQFLTKCRPAPQIVEDKPIIAGQLSSQSKTQHMKRFINQKSQQIVTSLPDLPDNFCLFGQLKEQNNRNRMKSTIVSKEQDQQINQFLPLEDKPVNAINSKESSGKIPGYNKHKSMGSFMTKKSSVSEISPLMRVQELLKNMKNIQNQKSQQKEKKMLNINIPKQIHEWGSTPKKQQTPCKKCKKQLQNYVSAQKQNIAYRLITQKPKNEDEGSGLDSIKVKSTILAKDKKDKSNSQMFTARKMKLQIQNIINKRNRQLRQDLKYVK